MAVVYSDEKSLVFEKQFECPLCNQKFRQPMVRTGKAKVISHDNDLRAVYQGVDVYKYDVVLCNHCGYAATQKYFGPLAKPHRDMLREHVSSKFKPVEEVSGLLTYEEAIKRFKMVMLNAMSRQAKISEKAYICLRMAWMLRGYIEQLEAEESAAKADKIREMELQYLELAMDGFAEARQSEMPPIAGMNEVTVDFLLAQLCYRFERYDEASKYAQGILMSSSSSSQQKEKVRELIQNIKDSKQNEE